MAIFALDQRVAVDGGGEGVVYHYTGYGTWHVHLDSGEYVDIHARHITPIDLLSVTEELEARIELLQSYCEMVADIINPEGKERAKVDALLGEMSYGYAMLMDVRHMTDED